MAKGTLNLDDLFGTTKPILVEWQGERYELRRPEALTPPEFNSWMKLQGRMSLPGKSQSEIEENWSEETGRELAEVVDEIIRLICPKLAARDDLTFMMKSKILEFYASEAFPDQLKAAEKLLGSEPKNSTGA